jgi:hypothetical protein
MALRSTRTKPEDGRGAGHGGQQSAGGVQLHPLAVRFTQRLASQIDHQQADRNVDQERDAPGNLGQRAADDQAHHRTDTRHGGEHRRGGVTRRPLGECGRDQR